MSGLRFYAYPGWGQKARELLHYSSAVRLGDRIEISGQGGWDAKMPDGKMVIPDDVNEEIDNAFKNVDIALKDAGGKGWSQVYKVDTYATDIPSTMDKIVENYRKWMPDHCPLWNEIGVKELGNPKMRIEIVVFAYDPEGAKAAGSAKE